MLTVLLVCPKITQFELVKDCLLKSETVNVLEAETVDFGLKIAKETTLDLVVVAEELDVMSGLEFVNILVKANPFINTALVSSLSSKDFHEETEGLGVLMQLPLKPQKTDAEELLQKMEKITSLMSFSRDNEVTT
jgi:response regulator RpfG family c-di-GMP phosphodiesterase